MRDVIYKRYLLGVLLVILAFNYVDRTALALLMQYVKGDLGLSDTQLGFLSGIAFFLFYSVMGIPLARWADRGNRVTIITLTTALWSAMVALCGVAGTFAQLLLIRIGIAVGEAGCVPTAHSLIADYFSRADRPRASAIYHLGTPLSFVIGYFGAGWLNEAYGWRMTFVLLGVPGLLLATLARLTLREPRLHAARGSEMRDEATGIPSASPAQPRLAEVARVLWENITFRHVLLAYCAVSFFGSGIAQWKPSFFIRSYGMDSGELGTWFALISGGGGLIGTYLGGVLASRYAANNEHLQLKIMASLYCVYGLSSAFMYISPNPYLAFGLMSVAFVGGGAVLGPLFATIQTLVPDRMRAISIAIVFLIANLIGNGLGPLAAGALSDGLRPWFDEESLRYALLILCPGYFWCAWHLGCASKSVTRDLERLYASPDRRLHESPTLESSAIACDGPVSSK